jgi:hypothetical protein
VGVSQISVSDLRFLHSEAEQKEFRGLYAMDMRRRRLGTCCGVEEGV